MMVKCTPMIIIEVGAKHIRIGDGSAFGKRITKGMKRDRMRWREKKRHSTSIIVKINAHSWSKRARTVWKRCEAHTSTDKTHIIKGFAHQHDEVRTKGGGAKDAENRAKVTRNDNLFWHLLNVPEPWWEIIICDLRDAAHYDATNERAHHRGQIWNINNIATTNQRERAGKKCKKATASIFIMCYLCWR